MSYANEQVRALARVVIQLEEPCAIGTGAENEASDMPFYVDANGIPMIPGTSIAGMLRAAFLAHTRDEGRTDALFGYQRRGLGQGSRVRITSAHLHDEDDRPVDGALVGHSPSNFIQTIAVGDVRDHVALDAFGAAKERAKFDRQVLYSGIRFTFDIELLGAADEREQIIDDRALLLGLLASGRTRLGARVHSAHGAFRLVRASGIVLDLADAHDFSAYNDLPVALDAPFGDPLDVPSVQDSRFAQVRLSLNARSFFSVAGGREEDSPHDLGVIVVSTGQEKTKKPDIVPMRSRRVRWSRDNKGTLSKPTLLIPGSAIKGALSHRVAFHYNRLAGDWATAAQHVDAHSLEQNAGVRELFGYARDDEREDVESRGGKVYVPELVLSKADTVVLTHNGIDAFTGGTRMNVLFTEEVISPMTIELTLHIERADDISALSLRALRLAIQDLEQGRLVLGGGHSRGHGRFESSQPTIYTNLGGEP